MAKILKIFKEGRLKSAIISRIRHYLLLASCIKYCFYNPASKSVCLHYPGYVKPDNGELKIVERIFEAFKKMKNDERSAAAQYLPSSLWQEQIDRAYSYLSAGLKGNDIGQFHYFLSNFGRWTEPTGIESNVFMQNIGTFLGRLYIQNKVFLNQLKIWKWFYSGRKPVSSLSYPTHGNQTGAYIGGVYAGVGSFFNEIYGSILVGLVRDKERPVIADLGAGFGKLDYFILRDLKNFTFIDFDLPEVLCLASYYLMKTYPDKKALLYGEGEYASDIHKKFDLIFMPCWEIAKTGPSTVDLFINRNSLGEMSKNAVNSYISCIADSARYFFHMNHDIHRNNYQKGERGLLGHEYPVPGDKFRLLFRYPDMGHMLYQGFLDTEADIFMYLYERKA